jgi:transposase-like protein
MSMIALIADNRDAIAALCRQYGVQRLGQDG